MASRIATTTAARSRGAGIRLAGAAAAGAAVLGLGACTPSVKLEAPDEPIRFDVNVNVTEEKRVQIDQALLDLIQKNPKLFGFEPGEVPTGAPGPSGSAPGSGSR